MEKLISDGRIGEQFVGSVSAEDQIEEYWDDLSGQKLDGEKVKAAREEEMQEFRKFGVYDKVPEEECWKITGKDPIGTRWVDINKGDDENSDYRSRLVAQEIKRDKREDLFAATPPLEALKILLALAVMGKEEEKFKIDVIDVRRAYFHADAVRPVYVKLPPEDFEQGKCGKLRRAMYGTRDAALNWEKAYMKFLEEAGFIAGKFSPCVFYHSARKLRAVVHGDDFTVSGPEDQLNWFRSQIQARFEVKFKARLGPDRQDDKIARVLNRVIEWDDKIGIRYEADQRHA